MGRIKQTIKKILARLPSSTVIMLHHIDDGELNKKSECVLAKNTLTELLDARLPFISMDAYCKRRFARRNPCTLTFDDGLRDVYRVAYPELKRRGIPFTLFIVTDYLDTDGYLTTQELRELAADPLVTVGSHGTSHALLTELPAQAQLREFAESKRVLQEITGKEIRLFAYSHGLYDRTTLELMKKHKLYDAAFIAGGGQTNLLSAMRRYRLPRANFTDQTASFHIIRGKDHDVLKLE